MHKIRSRSFAPTPSARPRAAAPASVTAVLLALALAAAACSGSGDDPDAGGDPGAATDAGAETAADIASPEGSDADRQGAGSAGAETTDDPGGEGAAGSDAGSGAEGAAGSAGGAAAGSSGDGALSSSAGAAAGAGGDGTPGSDGDAATSSGTGSGGGAATEAATGSGGEITVNLGAGEVVLTSALTTFGECGALLDHLRREYAARVGPWGFDRGWDWFGPVARPADVEIMVDAADSAAEAPTGAAAGDSGGDLVQGVDFSGTNVVESGVDEADLVKTDGRRVFVVSGGQLVVVDAAARRVTGAVKVAEGWSAEMFVKGDEVLLLMEGDGSADESEWPRRAVTILQRISVADGRPVVAETMEAEGSYLSARSVDGVARVIMRHDPSRTFPFVYPQNPEAESVAEESNRRAVLASSLEDWLPDYTLSGGDASPGPRLLPDCDAVHIPSQFSGFGVTTVLNVAVDGALPAGGATSVMVPGDTVYASPDSLYVTSATWLNRELLFTEEDGTDGWDELIAGRHWRAQRVNIHRFDISDPLRTRYTASGSVPGEIHNEFSLSEHDRHLRVVTTTRGFDGDASESQVRVLRESGGKLAEVGSVGDIGRGERVQSVRFVGEVGYVVTFRQIDPFYTIDLADPANPVILGELKIPGFSSYLHPISDDLVLGVGSDADDSGRVTGAKVSLFDVSDLADPREVAVWIAPDGWNDIGWDHRAFLWWSPLNLAVIPVTVWEDQWSGAVVLKVEGAAIAEVGRIDHLALDPDGQTDCRRLTSSDLPSSGSPGAGDGEANVGDLEFALRNEPNAVVIVCGVGSTGVSGYRCWGPAPLAEEARELGIPLRDDETVEICYPGYWLRPILRNMVISGELWSLSSRSASSRVLERGWLTVSDLDSLRQLAAIELD